MNKKDFYDSKELDYKLIDEEAIFRYNRALELARLTSGIKLLDIGCKYALLRDLIIDQKLSIDYSGIDISDKVFEKIKNFDPAKFFVADVSKSLPFEDNSFDYIFALEIMEHVESPTLMLNEIHRVLKNDGVLILSCPNVYAWNEIVANLKRTSDTEGHISGFTYQIMERLLKFNNLIIEKYCGTFTRVAFSRRFLADKYWLLRTDNIFLTRSFIYRIQKLDNK